MYKILIGLLFMAQFTCVRAQTLLRDLVPEEELAELLIPRSAYMPLPLPQDRGAWEGLSPALKEAYVSRSICEESDWGVPAHYSLSPAGTGLPDVTNPWVDLFAAETVNYLAWVDYLMGEQLDSIPPLIEDEAIKRKWGDEIYRISLKTRESQTQGRIKIEISSDEAGAV